MNTPTRHKMRSNGTLFSMVHELFSKTINAPLRRQSVYNHWIAMENRRCSHSNRHANHTLDWISCGIVQNHPRVWRVLSSLLSLSCLCLPVGVWDRRLQHYQRQHREIHRPYLEKKPSLTWPGYGYWTRPDIPRLKGSSAMPLDILNHPYPNSGQGKIDNISAFNLNLKQTRYEDLGNVSMMNFSKVNVLNFYEGIDHHEICHPPGNKLTCYLLQLQSG